MLRKILIVDDSEINRGILCDMLGEIYEVIEAENGKDALSIMHQSYKTLSAVVLDLEMPVMDGYTVLKKVNENPMLSQIPIIVATGNKDEETELNALSLGAVDFVTKPYNLEILIQRLKNTIHLREMASFFKATLKDDLTGIYNRKSFFITADRMVKGQDPGYYVMACLDIDRFKVINDQYGNEKGDEILKRIARIFDRNFSAVGGICSRIMADDFVALYPRSFIDSEALAQMHSELASLDKQIQPISFSIGRYIVDDPSLPVSGMYDRALLAQSAAKGRFDNNIVYYDESMRERLLHEQRIAGEMRNALETEQFEVWLQPQYNHATGALIGSEALVRWRNPQDGSLIPPGDFIPIFERNGFIYEMDKYVWRKTCELLRRWIDEGQSPLPVSVNISRCDMLQESFISAITGLVEQYALPVDLLRIEITESAFSENTNHIIHVTKQLIEYGFSVEIDDFGSGYSSLNTLKDVPAQILKLDMRFLDAGEDVGRGGNILESVVRMAKWLGMAVIAEGVETIEQADYLKSIGCVYVQGYLYERPIPVKDYEALFKGIGKEEKLLALQTVKNLDNSAFWDPKSMDTLIFNSFVGGACIMEHRIGHIEVLRATDKFIQMLNSDTMTVDDALKLDWVKYTEKASAMRFREAVFQSIDTNDEITIEGVFLDLPGCPAITHLRITLRVIATAGEHCLVYCTNENITAQKELENKERVSTVQLQTIMANINSGVTASVVENGVPRILFANERFYSQYGYTKEQFETEVKNPHDLLHPDDVERVTKETAEASEINQPFSTVCRIIRRDGTVCWLQTNVTIIRLPGVDSPVQLAVTADITAQRELEEKERTNAAQLQAIMDNINGGVSMSVMRNGFPKIIFANDQFYSQRGYTKEQYEAEITDSSMIFHPDDLERVHHTARTATGSHSEVYRILRRDGAVRWVQNNITEVDMPGYDEVVKLSVSNDITELRRAERKEHEVSERLQAILAALNSGVSAVTTSGDGTVNYVFANDMFYSMLGLTREQFEIEGSNLLNLIHPDDRERIDMQLAALIEGGGNTVFEYRVIRPDNETIHLRVDASLLSLDGVDKPVVLGVSSDVTDMVKAQRKISDLSERMQAVLENVDCGITASEIDGTNVEYLFCNDRFYEINGYTKAQYEAEVRNPFELIHPNDRQGIIESIAKVNRAGQDVVLEYRITRRDGQIRWMHTAVSARAISGASHPIQFAAYTDITDEKLARERIRQASEQMQAMMDDMPGGFARLRLSPDGSLATVYVNENICLMRGLTRDEVLSADGQDATGAIHPDDLELVRSTVREMISTGKTGRLKYRLKHADGSYYPYSVYGRVSEGDDGDIYINAYYADLSEQEKKELTIRETVPLVLSSILASSTNLAFAKDRDSRYICGSSEFMKMTNYAHESEIIGKTDHEIFPQEIADILRSNDLKLLETGTPMLDYVQALPLADGSLHYYQLSKYVLRDASGNMLGVYGIGRDITEEKDAYARLKLLVDSIPGGIASYIASPKGIRNTYFNDAFCGIFGYTRAEYERISAANIASLTFAEDVPRLMEQIQALLRDDTPVDITYRVHTKNGGYKWVNMRGGIAERHGEICVLNGVLYDVTERMETEAALRMSEQEFRIAAAIGGRTVARFDLNTGVYRHTSKYLLAKGFDSRIENVPQAIIDAKLIAPECIDDYLAFYDRLRQGESPCSVDVAVPGENGAWLWFREEANVMLDEAGQPAQAIIVFTDITELREKETVFRKWQQSLNQRPKETYMLFRCNLSKNSSFDSAEGKLLWVKFASAPSSFNERTGEYVSQCVFKDDRAEYLAFLNADTLLANYYRGVHTKAIEYREVLPDGSVRWLRLTVELVEYPNSTDVEVFLLYEDIDAAKRDELRTRELAEIDPLTGVLNRAAFSQAVERALSEPTLTSRLAILMLDIDTFKHINDTLGHSAGDQVLIDTANTLRSVLRHDDLLGRLGGDEFLICLRDVYDDEAVTKKAEHICALLNKSLNLDVQTSTSIGIAVCPRDGKDFETLYSKADTALYKVKASGKNNFAFYNSEMEVNRG